MKKQEANIISPQIGFRLEYMELLNWGTFNRDVWRVSPNGYNSLLTGSIGSGKSTLVDALTTLIVPHHKINFNKAAGAEKNERSLLTYIKGEYKNSKSDETDAKGKPITLRYKDANDTTFSVVLANFTNIGYGSNITLAQVFWIENEKAQKLLVISNKPLTIKEHFDDIENARELRRRIKALSSIEYEGDSFPEYSQKFRHLFGMNSDKAIELFYQTVSMKAVKSLTSFVRDQMLEKTEIETQLEELKKRFDDLNKAYAAVQQARRQKDILKPIVEFSTNYSAYEKEIQEIDNILQSIPSYFASKKIILLQAEIESCEGKLNQLNNQLLNIEAELKAKRKAENQLNQDIESNGGSRLKVIAGEIERYEESKQKKKDANLVYTQLCADCEIAPANSDKAFYSNLKAAQQKIIQLSETQDGKLEEQGKVVADVRIVAEEISKEERELESLKSRMNQIPTDFLYIRQELSNDLDIGEDEIPFAGELLKVRDNDQQWEGAIEKLLRGFGISMLVPEKHYKLISQYINARTLADRNRRGLKLDYFMVPHNFSSNNFNNEIDDDSVVNKIEIKANSEYFEDWLQSELEQRFNLRCVSLEEFQRQKRDVITIEGQYKIGKRHTKDDRRSLWDRKNFVLGWTNIAKVKAVEQHLSELDNKKENLDSTLIKLKNEIKNNATLNTNLNLLVRYTNWHELNWQDDGRKIAELEQEKQTLENSNDVLKTLQQQVALIGVEINEQEKKQKEKTESIGGIKSSIEEHKVEIATAQTTMQQLSQNEKDNYYPLIEQQINTVALTFKNVDSIAKELNTKFTGKNGEKDKLNAKLRDAGNGITRVMQEFKKEFPSECLDLSVEVETRAEFMKLFEKIISEGLPSHEARFKEMLNKNTIDDIRVFDAKLDSHAKQIQKKIEEINKHLKEIEFNKGTYLKLVHEKNPDAQIRDFKRDLRECYEGILEASDAYTESRFTQVKRFLDRFMSNKTEDIEWTKKVTDVRNWFLFNASEKYLEGDLEKEFYADSSGKSGGQKEKLAYTILASALVYQFGLTYGEPKSKSFRFVVIDEAFGRGDDESTQFGLGLFKKLSLQLLIVTPLQKIHVIENYINAVHYVTNTEGKNSEVKNLTVEEYKEQKLLRKTENGVEVIESLQE